MEINNTVSPEITRVRQRFGITGNAPALVQAIERAIRVAPIDLSVLVTGESGTGKEFFPKIIHAYSPRKHARYIAVNCGAIPEGTIDSELFGHEKGAFTGAVAERRGYFEEADGGTIFLDEVAELPLTTQARLLRVLETGEYLRVGSSQVRKTNIRIVAATNVDIPRAVRDGRFREDLYYRLSTVAINIPPLRDRGSDITLLARKFAIDFAERYHTPELILSPDATRELLDYRWPGNVRQLKNVIEQLSLFEASRGPVSTAALRNYLPAAVSSTPAIPGGERIHDYQQERDILFNMIFRLQQRIDRLSAAVGTVYQPAPAEPAPQRFLPPPPDVETIYHPVTDVTDVSDLSDLSDTSDNTEPSASRHSAPLTIADAERQAIADALKRNDGRRRDTARELGLSERTLYRKLRQYGLE